MLKSVYVARVRSWEIGVSEYSQGEKLQKITLTEASWNGVPKKVKAL